MTAPIPTAAAFGRLAPLPAAEHPELVAPPVAEGLRQRLPGAAALRPPGRVRPGGTWWPRAGQKVQARLTPP